LEQTVEAAVPEIAAGSSAAFAVEVDGEERLVVASELADRRPLAPEAVEAIARAIRRALAREHGIQAFEVVLLRPGGLAKTTSGKVRGRAGRGVWGGGGGGGVGTSRRRGVAAE